jgi:hypothetical protein
LTSDGLKLRVESLDASGQVFATDEANTLTRGTLGDPEEPWRASGLPIRYTRLSSDIPADAPGEELVDRAASAGIPISATLYVTGTPHSGQLEVVDQDTSWAVVYEPASPAVFAVVVAPGDLAPPMWWHFWPGIRQAARPPLVQVDTASVALPADAQALEYPDGGGAMVTWLDGDVRAAVLALETSEALRVAELLSDGAR